MLLWISVMITVCLSLVLVVILFKLYQTYQQQPSPYQASNNSFTSLDTQISSFHSQVELQPVFTTGQVWTSYHASEGLGGSVRTSQTCDLLYKDACRVESDTRYRNKEKLIEICRESSASFCKSDIKGKIQRDYVFTEQTGNNDSMPEFIGKWQFPKHVKNLHNPKYWSLWCKVLLVYCLKYKLNLTFVRNWKQQHQISTLTSQNRSYIQYIWRMNFNLIFRYYPGKIISMML